MCYFCWFLKYNYGFSKQRIEKASEAGNIVYEESMRKEIDGYLGTVGSDQNKKMTSAGLSINYSFLLELSKASGTF